jgi:hypothetical protein
VIENKDTEAVVVTVNDVVTPTLPIEGLDVVVIA